MAGIKYYVIIVAGGTGSRMGSEIPKQFLQLNGRPVLMHTIDAFHSAATAPEIILVLNADFHQYWKDLCLEYNFSIPHQLVKGGEHRFHSVRNGLKSITQPAIVAIHDAVRPCISHEIINLAFRQAEAVGNAVVAVKSRDSIRQSTKTGTISLNRDDIYLIQTPQVFKSELLQKAYEQEYRKDFTDDASVVEESGVEIKLIPGDTRNLKITYPEDILIAQNYLGSKKTKHPLK